MRRALWVLVLSACTDPETGDDDYTWTNVYDDNVAEDTQDTGTTEDTDTTLRDGCYAEWAYDAFDDGSVDGTGIDVYDAVHTDLLVRSERQYGSSFDRSVTTYDYDGEWRLVRYAYDDENDGNDDYVVVYTYDTYDHIASYEYDTDGDDHLDVIYLATWTPEGDLLTFSRDDDADGDPDYGYAYTYEGDLRVAATEDQDGDEVTDHWYAYSYDEVPRLVLIVVDEGNDGIVDAVGTRTYTDPLLMVGSSATDDDNDGDIDDWSTFAYDALDRLLSLTEDEGADEFVDFETTASYDPATGFVAVEDAAVFTPPPDDDWLDWSHNEYTYDSQARLVVEFNDGAYADDDFEFLRLNRQTWTFGGTCP